MGTVLTGTTTSGKFSLTGTVGTEYIFTPTAGPNGFPNGETGQPVDMGEALPAGGVSTLVIPLAFPTAAMAGTVTLADGVTAVPDGTVITATPKA